MKKISALLMMGLLVCSAAFAALERIQVTDQDKAFKAKADAASIDLARIDDPDARAAIKAIFGSLGLKAKS